ncbi:MAG TPA: terminase family protein, partial [Verrucomicrobiae bacterium]|nr:terminase family protein [Verrucomicrobiae bacterium]
AGDGRTPAMSAEELQAKFEAEFRPYQRPIFQDERSGILILHWARQVGKSHVLAAWAVRRLLRHPGRLVVVLSNSRENGAEFVQKCADFTVKMGQLPEMEDLSPDLSYRNMRFEVRITVQGKVGRIKVVAANPRTARGFSGDLILDEFAFHEDSTAIWEAAEPILSANPGFLCRIASTANGKHNMFYRMANGGGRNWSLAAAAPLPDNMPREIALMGRLSALAQAAKEDDEGDGDYEWCSFSDDAQNKPSDRTPHVAQTSKSAVSRVSKPADCPNPPSPTNTHHAADSEIGDTAGLETGATTAHDTNAEPELCAPGSNTLHDAQPSCSEEIARLLESAKGKPNPIGAYFLSAADYTVSCVTRSAAHVLGVPVFDPATRAEITPAQARARALDKRAYDQNYECLFADENLTLLSQELISAAERSPISIDDQQWSPESITRMAQAKGNLEVGNDIGRNRDLSYVTVIERDGDLRRVVAMLRMQNMRLPDQQKQLDVVCGMPKFKSYCGDITGLGLGLVEYLQQRWGNSRIHGVNFATSEPITEQIANEGRKHTTARVTEIMATNLLALFEDRRIEIPSDLQLRDDLRKPEKITSPGGRVSIAATRDEAGHADGFWSLALAVRASEKARVPFQYQCFDIPEHMKLSSRLGAATTEVPTWEEYLQSKNPSLLRGWI